MSNTAPDFLNHRERLKGKYLSSGLSSLHDYEILELLLSFAIPRKDVKPLAKCLLTDFESLKGVMDADLKELEQLRGISTHTAILIKLIKDICSLYLKQVAAEKFQISCTSELLDYCRMALGGLKDERFTVIYLNAQNKLIDSETIQDGIVNQAVVYPRKVLERALARKASAIILVHNHPSGHVTPSDADIRLTKLIQETAKILDIVVHDHIIIGENRAFSFREQGLIT